MPCAVDFSLQPLSQQQQPQLSCPPGRGDAYAKRIAVHLLHAHAKDLKERLAEETAKSVLPLLQVLMLVKDVNRALLPQRFHQDDYLPLDKVELLGKRLHKVPKAQLDEARSIVLKLLPTRAWRLFTSDHKLRPSGSDGQHCLWPWMMLGVLLLLALCGVVCWYGLDRAALGDWIRWMMHA